MMKYFVFTVCLMTSMSMGYAATGLDVAVGEEAVSFALHSAQTNNEAQLEFGVLRNDDDDITVVDAGVFVAGKRGVIDARLGVRAYAADLDNLDGYGLALGGDASVPLAAGISVNGGLFYGPSALAFSDIDNYQQWYISASIDVVENASLAAGVGSLELETDFGREIEVEDGFFVKMELSF